MSEIPVYPDECPHRKDAGDCARCIQAKLDIATMKLSKIAHVVENRRHYNNDREVVELVRDALEDS